MITSALRFNKADESRKIACRNVKSFPKTKHVMSIDRYGGYHDRGMALIFVLDSRDCLAAIVFVQNDGSGRDRQREVFLDVQIMKRRFR